MNLERLYDHLYPLTEGDDLGLGVRNEISSKPFRGAEDGMEGLDQFSTEQHFSKGAKPIHITRTWSVSSGVKREVQAKT